MDKEALKEIRKIVAIIAVVVLLIVYSGNLIDAIGSIMEVFKPFFAGVAIAFVLYIPMSVIEKKLMSNWTGKITGKLKRGISMIASVLIVLAVVCLVVFSLAPELTNTIKDVGARIPGFYDEAVEFFTQLTKDYPQINDVIKDIGSKPQDWEKLVDGFTNFMQSNAMGNIVSSTVDMASSIVVFVFEAIIAICFAVYLLINKEKLLRNIRIVFETYLPKNWFDYLHKAVGVLIDNFRAFIAGQCVEAIILGVIFAVVMAIMRIPYVLLVSVLIGFTALIPVAGAFIGCFIGAFLILMVSPVKMVHFLIIFIVIQQLENKLIYPRVVGSSIGLPAIWVFVAVTVGGSISGVFGMLVFIPLASTMYELLRMDVDRRRTLAANGNAYNRDNGKSQNQTSNNRGSNNKKSRNRKNKKSNSVNTTNINDGNTNSTKNGNTVETNTKSGKVNNENRNDVNTNNKNAKSVNTNKSEIQNIAVNNRRQNNKQRNNKKRNNTQHNNKQHNNNELRS